jgi:hypothetical protein
MLRWPGHVEWCDNLDNDCGDGVDEGCDDDDDGFCDDDMVFVDASDACPEGPGDCDDDEPATRPGVPEVCDLVDNDCNGASDESDPADAGQGGGTCGAAVSVGTLADTTDDFIAITGTIHSGDSDWYSVGVTDDADACGEEFRFQACWLPDANPGSDLRLDVYQAACPPVGACPLGACSCTNVGDADRADWAFTCPDGTDCCVGDRNSATDFSTTFYVRVYRADGAAVNCAAYGVKVKVGAGPCP